MADALSSISGITDLLSAISQRQKLVSNNVANAQTPGYTAQEISFSDMLAYTESPFETRLSHNMGRGQALETESGHPVNLETEMVEMQRNNLFYSMVTRRATTIFSDLRNATQVGK